MVRAQLPFSHRDADRIIIHTATAAAQHDMSMHIAAGAEHGQLTLLRDAEKMMWMAHRLQGVDRGR